MNDDYLRNDYFLILLHFCPNSMRVRSASKSTVRKRITTFTFAPFTGSENDRLVNGAAKMISRLVPVSASFTQRSAPKDRRPESKGTIERALKSDIWTIDFEY